MRFDYDPETDILTLILSDDAPDHGEQVDGIIAHYDAADALVEIEVLDASTTVPEVLKVMLERSARGKAPA